MHTITKNNNYDVDNQFYFRINMGNGNTLLRYSYVFYSWNCESFYGNVHVNWNNQILLLVFWIDISLKTPVKRWK